MEEIIFFSTVKIRFQISQSSHMLQYQIRDLSNYLNAAFIQFYRAVNYRTDYFLSSFCFSASSNKASLKLTTILAVRLCAVSGLPIMKSHPVKSFHEKTYSSSFSVSLLKREFSAILKQGNCARVLASLTRMSRNNFESNETIPCGVRHLCFFF